MANAKAKLSPEDQDFLEDSIMHKQEAIFMARKYLKESSADSRQARIADLARQDITDHQKDVNQLRSWLQAAGVTPPSRTATMKDDKDDDDDM